MTENEDTRFVAIWNKLRSGRLDVIAGGIGDLRATGDGALFDRFLEGATFEGGAGRSDKLQVVLQHVILSILAEAPDSSKLAPPLREAITSLNLTFHVDGVIIDRDRFFPRFPNLTWLTLTHARLAGTASHPRLQSVRMALCEIDDLAGLVASPCLTTLTLARVTLAGGAPIASLDALKGATALETLEVGPIPLTDVRALACVPSLRHLTIGASSNLTSLDGLEGAAELETVQVSSTALTDVRALASAQNLRCLKLTGCSALSDISALEGHPSLRVIGLYNTAVEKDRVAPRLRAICTWAKNANYDKLAQRQPQKTRRSGAKAGRS